MPRRLIKSSVKERAKKAGITPAQYVAELASGKRRGWTDSKVQALSLTNVSDAYAGDAFQDDMFTLSNKVLSACTSQKI